MERTKQLHVFIKPELHKWLKVEAAKQGRSVTDLLEEILETEIEKIQKRYVLHNNLESRKAYFFLDQRSKGIARKGHLLRQSRPTLGSPTERLAFANSFRKAFAKSLRDLIREFEKSPPAMPDQERRAR